MALGTNKARDELNIVELWPILMSIIAGNPADLYINSIIQFFVLTVSFVTS